MRRAGLLAGALALAGLALAWWGVERAIDVDRYRSLAERELADWTGHPVSIGRLELQLRPLPRLTALAPEIGAGEFRARAQHVHLLPRLAALLERRIELVRVEVEGLELTLPGDPGRWTEVWSGIAQRIEARLADGGESPSPLALALVVERVEIEDAVLRRAQHPGEALRASVAAHSDERGLELEGELSAPHWGVELDGALRVGPQTGSVRPVAGAFALRGLRTDVAASLPEPLRAALDARVEVEGGIGERLALTFDGELEPDTPVGLSGPVRGRIGVDLAAARALEFELETRGARATGTAAAAEGEDPHIHVEALDLAGQTLHTLLAALESESLALGGDAAALEARGLRIALPPAAAPRPVDGRVSARGLEVAWQGRALAAPWHGEARVEDGALHIESLASGAVALTGRIAPRSEGERYDVALTGSAALDPDWLALFDAPVSLSRLSGDLVLEALHAALPPDPEAPLRFRVRLRGGALTLEADSFRDAFTGLELALAGEGGALSLTAAGQSGKLGALRASARRAAAEGAPIEGWLEIDATDLAAAFTEGALADRLAPALRAYGPSRLDFALRETGADTLGLRAERRGEPPLEAVATLHSGPGRSALGALEVSTALPAEALAAGLSEAIRAAGVASLRLRREGDGERFALELDAGEAALALGPLLEKRRGEPLSLSLAGGAGFEPEELEIRSGPGQLRFARAGETWAARDLALELAHWSALLPAGAELDGRLAGDLSLAPFRAALQLDGAGCRLAPGLPRVAVDGGIDLSEASWRARALRLRAPDTDLSLDGEWSPERVAGRIAGPALDLDLLRAHVYWVRALAADEAGPGVAAPPADPDERARPQTGELEISVDRLTMARGAARALRAHVRLEGGALRAAPISLETYEGRMAGELSLSAEDRLALSLALEGVRGRFLDDLFFSGAPRGLRGTLDGSLRFDAPLGADARGTLARGHGALTLVARDGSLGRLGFATRLVTALRASEVLRLRLPAFRDEGLVFDRLEAAFSMREGVMLVDRFDLESKVYAITATGELDFAADTSKVSFEVDAIRGIAAIIEPIPVAGDALKIANVRLTGSGSPYAMKIGVASIRDQVVGAAHAGSRATIGRVRDALRLLRPGAAGAPAEGEAADPADAPAEPAEPAPEER